MSANADLRLPNGLQDIRRVIGGDSWGVWLSCLVMLTLALGSGGDDEGDDKEHADADVDTSKGSYTIETSCRRQWVVPRSLPLVSASSMPRCCLRRCRL